MRNLCRLLLALVLAGFSAEVACAQNTTVTAGTGTLAIGGQVISTGVSIWVPVDSSGKGVAVTKSGGGLSLPVSSQPVNSNPIGYVCTITAGGYSSGCPVPDSGTANPVGFNYNITFVDTSTGNPTSGMVATLTQVHGVTGTSWALDHYAPLSSVQTAGAFTYTQGVGAPTGSFGANSFYADIATPSAPVLYTNVSGNMVQVGGGSGGSVTAAAIQGALVGRTGCVALAFYRPYTNDCAIQASTSIALAGAAIADYKFLDGAGTSISDASGNGNAGTLTSGALPTWVAGGLSFSGQQNASLPSALNTAKTIEIVAYLPPLPVNVNGISSNPYPAILTNTLSGAAGLAVSYSASLGSSTGTIPALYGPTIFANGAHSTQCAQLLSGLVRYTLVMGTGSGNLDHVYINGQECSTYGLQGSSAGAMTSGNFLLGTSSTNSFWGTSSLNGTLYRARFVSGQLTAAQVAVDDGLLVADTISRGASIAPPSVNAGVPTLLAIGDSITNGAAGGNVTPWENLMTLGGYAPVIVNAGIGGVTMQAIAGSEPWRLAPYCNSSSGPVTAVVLAGTNDGAYLGTIANVFAAHASEVQTLKKAGCRVFSGTMLSRGGTTSLVGTPSWDSFKNSYNALILSQARAAGADGIIDFASDPSIGADGANATASFISDHVHPTQTKQNRMGVIASNSLNYYFSTYSDANPFVVTTSTTLSNAQKSVSVGSLSGNIAIVTPDCTGPSGEKLRISNPQAAHAVTITGVSAGGGTNLFSSSTVTEGSILGLANPTLITLSGWWVSDYIPVTPGQVITITDPETGTASYGGAFYTNNTGTSLFSVNGDTGIPLPYTSGQTFTVPAGAAYMRVTGTDANLSTQAFTVGGGAGTGSQPINGLLSPITIPANSTVTLTYTPNPKTVSGCGWTM